MLRFHNRVVDDNPELEFPAQQRVVRWHYQWVVVHDFLSKIVAAPVLEDLKTNGKFDRSKLRFFHWKNEPFIPVEFSVACYRLGHSMIRPGYRLNDDDSTLLPIFPIPPNAIKDIPAGMALGLIGFQEMAKNRGIDWGRFIDLEGDVRAYGGDPDTVKPVTADMKARLQFAYRIDTSVVTPLSLLPATVASDPPPSLPQRNLLRGFELGLPTGQDVAHAMGITPLTDEEIVIGKAVDAPSGDDVLGKLSDLPQLSAFFGKCPLWTYILAGGADTDDAEYPGHATHENHNAAAWTSRRTNRRGGLSGHLVWGPGFFPQPAAQLDADDPRQRSGIRATRYRRVRTGRLTI